MTEGSSSASELNVQHVRGGSGARPGVNRKVRQAGMLALEGRQGKEAVPAQGGEMPSSSTSLSSSSLSALDDDRLQFGVPCFTQCTCSDAGLFQT